MSRESNQQKIALAVGIALSAGVFSIMPSASAAPVVDHVVSGGAVIDQKTTPNVTDVTSTTRNNVIDWQDFSVSHGETVRFDGGAKTNNYLNVVSGVNTSHIDGAIKGGNNVYIVNPNGVVFGNSASVDVGSLYVSSRPLDTVNFEKTDAAGDMQPLADTASMSGGDIVNMGTVQANSVFVEGGNIIISDAERIKTADGAAVNNNVTIQTQGNITIGRSVSSLSAEQNANDNHNGIMLFANTADNNTSDNSGYTYTFNSIADYMPLIKTTDDLLSIPEFGMDKSYTLNNNLNFSGAYTPIGTESNPFTGTFDGQFHTVSGITVSEVDYGGLFGYTDGATIKNVGVINGSINAAKAAGAVAGYADSTIFTNVFNESTSVGKNNDDTGIKFGGIVGETNGGEINTAYNTGDIGDSSVDFRDIYSWGGVVGKATDTTITNVYNRGEAQIGIVGEGSGSLTNAYSTTGHFIVGEEYNGTKTNVIKIDDSDEYKRLATYTDDDTNTIGGISNEGGKSVEEYPWRIYEGQSLPLLRAFLTAHGTVNVNYDYAQGNNKGSRNGQDLSVTYNGKDIELTNISYTKGDEAFSPTSGIITSPKNNVIDGNVIGLDSSGEVLTKAAFYTGQQGYDLVGNNYTIKQREVNVNAALGSANFVKEYDGEYKLTESDVAGLFASTGESSGIVDADKDKVKIGFSGTLNSGADNAPIAVYKDSLGNIDNTNKDAGDVGLNKKVYVGGTLALTGNDKHNYKLVASTGDGVTVDDDTGAITIAKELTGTIYHKILKVGFNEQALNRQYDGTSVAKETVKASDFYLQDSKGNPVTNSADLKLVIDSSNDKAYFLDSNNGSGTGSYTTDAATYVGTHDVVFNGITLGGNKAKNYVLLDVNNHDNVVYASDTGYIHKVGDSYENTGVPANNGKWITQGEITPRALSDYGFYWYDDVNDTTGSIASRQYNAGADFTYVDADNTNPIKGKIVNNNVTEGVVGLVTKDAGKVVFEVDSAEFIKSATDVNAGTATDVSGTNGAHGVRYKVKVKGADNLTDTEIGNILKNYEFGGNVLNTTETYSVAGEGEITPRTIKIGAAASADKMYDADAIVKTDKGNENNEFTLSATENDGYLDYTGDDQYKLLDDGTQIIYTGEYQNTNGEGEANVNFDGAQVAEKNITYTATIKGGNGNYVFANSTAVDADNNPQITISNGVGKITQREITSLYFKDVTKDYDTTATVNHDGIAVDVGSGDKKVKLYGSDSDNPENVFDMGKVTGVYVHKAEGKNDADVENGGAAKSKNVTYTLSDGFVKNHNYKLADNIGETVNGAGAITQATLDDRSKLALAVSGVTKVYDGDNDIKGAGYTDTDNKSKAFIGTDGLTYDLNGNKVTLSYDVYKAYYDSKDSKNGTAQGITYELSVSGDSTGNYTIGSGLLTDGYLKWNKDVTGWTDAEKAKMTGTITKKDVTVTPLHDLVTKVYDGGTAVKDGTTVLENDTAVSFAGWIDGTKSVTANYSDKNVDNATETAAGGKQVNYVITLDDTSKGNYTLKDAAGNTLTDYTLTGKGHITPATLTISFAPVSKIYDGTKNYDSTSKPSYAVTPTIKGRQTDAASGNPDDVDLNADEYKATFKSADKGTWDVTYTIVLKGEDKGNYQLAGRNLTTTDDDKTTIDGTGTIAPFALTDEDVVISFADTISKVYDATDAVAFDHTGDTRYSNAELGGVYSATAESYVNSITIGGVTLNFGTNGDYVINSANYNSSGIAANSATYKFQLQGSKLDNFDLTGLSENLYDQTNKVLTGVKSSGVSITPKQLQASLNDTVLDLERTYDGTASLPSTAEAASKVTVTGFVNVNGDTTAFDDSLVNGRYVDRNVAYDADGNITTKDVLFDVNLKGTGAENYVINNTNANSTTLTGANLGKITPKDLTVDFVYTDKVYNNNSAATVTGVTLDGRQTGDKALTLDTDTIVAEFGSKTGDTFTANGDVNYLENATDHEGYKGVQYSNLQAAMKAGFGTITAGNYTIADTVYFDEAAKKGKIKRLALVQSDIKTNWDTVTKEYDGTYAAPEGKLHIYTDKTGENIDLAYVLQDTDGAVYDNQQINVVQGADVTYTLNSLEAKEFKNFVMTEELMNSFNGKTYKTTGNITPRVLKINLNQAGNWVKTYDGTDAVKDATGAVVNSFDFTYQKDHNILDDDANTVNLVVTGAYVDADANIEPENTATTGKGIKYTLKLTGNDDRNYTLDSTNTTVGAVIETDDQTYTGDGAIKKRIVYAAFDDGYGTGIDRDYAGANDTSADASKTVRNRINLVVSTGGDTGLLDNDVTLKHDDISANYASANVSRNQQTKEVQAQDVYFTNFTLQDAGSGKSGNYAVRVNDSTNPNTLVGKGTIKPIKVTVGLIAVPKKDYDGTTGIEATYLANDNFTFTPAPVIASEDVANDIVITGAYKNANAGSKDANYADKEYTYTLTLNNGNYELVSGDDYGSTVTAGNEGMKATVTGADGIIKPRTISLKTIADMTKVYDGTTDADTGYMNNLEKNITFNNVVNNESLKLTGTAVYNDDANASDVETTAKPKKHQVKYTVNIGNTNYRLDDGTQYGTQDLTAYGDGYINRRTLSLVATPTSVNVGESMPSFTGKVTGFVGNEADHYSDFINGVTFKAADGVTTSTPGSYGVYGWYMGNKTGLLGLNYQFDQAPANSTAFTVNYVNNNTGNPDTKITPNNSIYHQISKDMNSGFGDNGAAAIEYKDKSGKVLGTEKIDSGEINSKGLMIGGGTDMSKQADSNANIGIAGGDIVNMEGANAAGSVNIETNGEETVVNLEVFSIDEEKESGTNNSTAEIINMDSQNGMASIEIRDEKQNIIGEDVRDKKDEKEGEIAIKSSNGKDDEIELTVEKQGVNVA